MGPTKKKDEWYYEEFSELLRTHVQRAKDLKISQKLIAERSGVDASTFCERILPGLRLPQGFAAFVQGFTETVYPDNTPHPDQKRRMTDRELKDFRADLSNRLRDAAAKRKPLYYSVLERVRAEEPLRLTSISYYPIAGSEGGWFESMMERFLDLAGIHNRTMEYRDGAATDGYPKTDVALGLFDSADRMLNFGMKFWRVPIRMGLGVICLRKHQRHAKHIADIITGTARPTPNVPIRLVVVKGDIGLIHCRTRLKISNEYFSNPPVDSLNITDLVQRLDRASDAVVPVVCTDEYTAFRVLQKLNDSAVSVFPMNSRRSSQRDETTITRRELPQYYCSVAVHGNDQAFQDFMQDALVQFLSTEIETTAHSLLKLATDLADKISDIRRAQMPPDPEDSQYKDHDAMRWAYAWEWVFYTLNLDRESIDSYADFGSLPWRPILGRARRLVQKHIGEQNYLKDLVELFWGSHKGQDRLQSLLDLALSNEFRNFNRRYMFDVIKRELSGSYALPITVDHHDPVALPPAALAIRRFMRRLQNIYDENDVPDAVNRIADEIRGIRDPGTPYGGTNGCVVLARLSGQTAFIGGACVRWEHEHTWEIRYLWVEPNFRGHDTGRKLIERVLNLAQEKGCTLVYVEILEKFLDTAAKLFKQMGFAGPAAGSETEPRTPPGRTRLEIQVGMARAAVG